jgi:hypothetical protein
MLYAKLAQRDDCRVVCGACGNGLAWISEALDHKKLTSAGPKNSTSPFPTCRNILIPEGWFPDADGIWRPSQRAKGQLRRGRPAQNRRLPKKIIEVFGRDNTKGLWGSGQLRMGLLVAALPAEIVCLYCEMRQTLDADRLNAQGSADSAPNAAGILADLAKRGTEPRRGFYPGAFQMPYFRGQDPRTKRWIAVADQTLALQWRREQAQRAGDSQHDESIDVGPSAVAESE